MADQIEDYLNYNTSNTVNAVLFPPHITTMSSFILLLHVTCVILSAKHSLFDLFDQSIIHIGHSPPTTSSPQSSQDHKPLFSMAK